MGDGGMVIELHEERQHSCSVMFGPKRMLSKSKGEDDEIESRERTCISPIPSTGKSFETGDAAATVVSPPRSRRRPRSVSFVSTEEDPSTSGGSGGSAHDEVRIVPHHSEYDGIARRKMWYTKDEMRTMRNKVIRERMVLASTQAMAAKHGAKSGTSSSLLASDRFLRAVY